MRRPEPGAVLLLAAAVLTGVVAVGTAGRTGVVAQQSPQAGLVFLSTQQHEAIQQDAPVTSRRYAEGPAGAVPSPPPQALRSSPAPAAPPGAPAVLGVVALLLGASALLRRATGLLLVGAGGALAATTVVVGLTGGHVVVLAVTGLLVLAGAALRAGRSPQFTHVHRDGGRMRA